MGAVFGFILGLYILGVVLAWPVFWARRTDRSQAPIERRLIGLMYALAWPVFAYDYVAGRRRAATQEVEVRDPFKL